jgi:hypothetical protein
MAGEPRGGTADDGMGDGHDRPLLAPTSRQALVPSGPRRPLGAGGGMSPLGQARAQDTIAPAGFPRPPFPGALVAARGCPRPGRQAAGRATAPPIGAPLGHPQLGAALVHPRPGSQRGDGLRKAHGGSGSSPPSVLTASPRLSAGSGAAGGAASSPPRPRLTSTLSPAIRASSKSIGANGHASSRRGWSRLSPVSACSSRGRSVRLRPGASSAIVAGSARPCRKAAQRARPEPPRRSGATAASLLLARSRTPWSRLTARLRSCPKGGDSASGRAAPAGGAEG